MGNIIKSIKLKLVFIYLALVFIVMIASGTFMLTQIRMQETSRSLESLKALAKNISENVIQHSKGGEGESESEALQNGLKALPMETSQLRGYILNEQGVTIAATATSADAEADPRLPVNRPAFNNDAVISAMNGAAKDAVGKELDTGGQYKEWLNYAQPVERLSDGAKYIIFTRTETKPMNDRLMEIGTTFFITSLLALVITGILGLLFANTITVPITRLTKKAKEMAHGDLTQEIPVDSDDEIGQLTESFNFMSSALNESMSTMAGEKSKMEVILHNMTDGVLAYDSAGALLHANHASMELLNFDDIADVPFAEMMAHLGAGVESMGDLKPGHMPDSTVVIGDKFISVSFSNYEDADGRMQGVVIVLQDITRHKKLDNMRKEFVANVSHEIRTPLTTIKSYTETLLDGALDERALAVEFLNVIESEADRMTFLARDLLELSRFDNQQLKLDFKDIDLIAILKQCIVQTVVSAEQKNQEIVFDGAHTDFWIRGDAARVNQVFTNIIDNAVKYSGEGTKIIIATEETRRHYRVYIKDSGVGIPREDLRRIFERFYRVDKARSRAMGGTGLGLSIAKEIMEAHGGRIFATSEPGKGTTMILRFNKEGEPESGPLKEEG